MNSKNLKYILLAIVIPLFTGCEDDFLELNPRTKYYETVAWKNKDNIDLYINGFYAIARDHGGFGSKRLGSQGRLSDGMSDILKYTSSVPGNGTTNHMVLTPDIITANQNALGVWSSAYGRVRRINEFLDGIDKYADILSESEKNQYKAQARFFRGWLYFLLTRNHGSVILLDKLTSNGNNPRSPEADCWEFVAKDFDYASKYLPKVWDSKNSGRVTKGAAFAFKSRAMVYAKRWKDAADAADSVMNMKYNGANLYELSSNYASIFNLRSSGNNKEVIFATHYVAPKFAHNFDLAYSPSGDIAGKGGQAVPTKELVDDYEMSDGTAFDWSDATHAANPYQNRDPRFYASVLYNGASWKGRTIETFVDATDDTKNGADAYVEYGAVADPAATVTGYYMRKFLDESNIDFVSNLSEQSWVELRLAEVILNYAEAKANMNEVGVAVTKLNKIRTRVGLPGISAADLNEFMTKFRHEKKIEMAFEGHRYWDLRRWRLARTKLHNVRMHGTKITKEADGTFKYETVDCDKRNRYFAEKYYYFPIPTSELNNNSACDQIDNW